MRRTIACLLVPFALIAAACGSDGEPDTAPETAAPTETDPPPETDADDPSEAEDESEPESSESDETDESPPDDAADDPDASAEDADDSQDSSAPTTEFREAEPHPGVDDDSIKVGILSLDWQALADAGVDLGRGTSTDLYVAAFEAINERGGVQGRTLELVVQEIFPIGAEEADAACAALTEDAEVFVTFGAMLQDSVLCYTELNETAVINFVGRTDERVERARAPYVTLLATQADIARAFIGTLEEQGILGDGVRVGVLGSADADEQAYIDVFDAFTEAGYDPVPGLIPPSQSDLAAAAREQGIILERFTSEAVDVTVSVTGLPVVVQNSIDAGYETDQWVFTALPDATELTDAGVDFSYLEGAVGGTFNPVGTSAQQSLDADPATRECLESLDAATGRTYDLTPGVTPNDLSSYLYACSGAIILERALEFAGPELDHVSLQAGFESIGDIELPGYGAGNLSADHLGAIDNLQYVEFDAATGVWNLGS